MEFAALHLVHVPVSQGECALRLRYSDNQCSQLSTKISVISGTMEIHAIHAAQAILPRADCVRSCSSMEVGLVTIYRGLRKNWIWQFMYRKRSHQSLLLSSGLLLLYVEVHSSRCAASSHCG